MALSLGALGKKVTLYNESPIPAVYRFLPLLDRIVRHIEKIENWDTALILDCGDIERIGGFSADAARIPVVINIDHHITNTRFGLLHYIDTKACSTAEIVYRLIKAMDISITKEIATSIYTGILTDTGSFRFANTNKAAFAICNEMIEKGVEPYNVARHVYGTYSLGRLKLLNLALDSIEILQNGRLSFMILTRSMMAETGTQPEDIDGMIHYAKRIEDVKVAVLIQENHGTPVNGKEQNRFHVSLRSDGSVDVSALAAAFGGGGHHQAAGFSITMPLNELKYGIIEWLEKCAEYSR
jgi:phosphoesterase RecJ-like protein